MIRKDDILHWVLSKDDGMSSRAMVAAALRADGQPELAKMVSCGTAHPWDPDDFGRCHRMLQAIPDVADYWDEIAAMSPVWAKMAEAWPKWTAIYLRDLPTGWSHELSRLMAEAMR